MVSEKWVSGKLQLTVNVIGEHATNTLSKNCTIIHLKPFHLKSKDF